MSINTIAKILIALGVAFMITCFILKAIGIFTGITVGEIKEVGLAIMSTELLVAISKNIDKFREGK